MVAPALVQPRARFPRSPFTLTISNSNPGADVFFSTHETWPAGAPTISLVVRGQPEYQEKEGSVEILWPNGAAPVQANCEISRFGNSWQIFAKRSFRVKCRASLGTSKLQSPLFNRFDRGVLAKTSFDGLESRSGSQDMVDRGF